MELKDMVLKKGDIITVEDKEGRWSVDIIIDEPQTLADRFLSEYNIISIKRPVKYETVYKAPKEILDKEEKEYLENFLRPFRDRVNCIEKCSLEGDEYISISLQRECIVLPDFIRNTMYKGMEVNKEYTLEELGLFKE